MCYKRVYSEVQSDGRILKRTEIEHCDSELCSGEYSILRDGVKYTDRRSSSREPTYTRDQFPPTPPLSYYSDYTSDSERSSRRRSGSYIGDNHFLDINRKRSSRHERQHSGDRSSYLSSSPLSRTPPLYHHSLPLSPARGVHDTYDATYREAIDDERDRPSSSHSRSSRSRPDITVEIINEPKGHRRHGSSSTKTSSRSSHEDERHRRRASDLQHGDQLRLSKESKIARQNKAIEERAPVVPVSSSNYRRGSVSVKPALTAAERRLLEEEKAERRRRKELEKAEERALEEQQQRLKDRFTPRRSNTIGFGVGGLREPPRYHYP